MYPDLTLWSPVVVAGLKSTRNYRCQSSYPLDNNYKKIEDVKVRIKLHQASVLGKAVESKVDVQVLCMLEDSQGQSCSISRGEILKDKVSLQEFDHLAHDPLELRYIHVILDFTWDADVDRNALNISYNLTYNLLAAREQLVQIQSALDTYPTANTSAIPPWDDNHIEQITEENKQLRKQMNLYEKNLGSLKRGIQKVENQNHLLNRELGSYKDMVDELKKAINRKDHIVCSFENEMEDITSPPTVQLPEAGLGKRIKRMFLNNQ